jgi:hypothetical protein
MTRSRCERIATTYRSIWAARRSCTGCTYLSAPEYTCPRRERLLRGCRRRSIMDAPRRPGLLTVWRVQLAPSAERSAASQSVLPSAGATKPSSETDILRTSEGIRCFLSRAEALVAEVPMAEANKPRDIGRTVTSVARKRRAHVSRRGSIRCSRARPSASRSTRYAALPSSSVKASTS